MSTKSRQYSAEIHTLQLTVASNEGEVIVEGDPTGVPLQRRDALRSFTGTMADGRSVPIRVERGEEEHEYLVYLRGETHRVRVVTPRDARLHALRKNTAAAGGGGVVLRAPMPGLLKGMLVAEGDQVAKGASLCILEAMKMENELKAPDTMVVRRLLVEPGSAVEKGAPLMELEPPEEPGGHSPS